MLYWLYDMGGATWDVMLKKKIQDVTQKSKQWQGTHLVLQINKLCMIVTVV